MKDYWILFLFLVLLETAAVVSALSVWQTDAESRRDVLRVIASTSAAALGGSGSGDGVGTLSALLLLPAHAATTYGVAQGGLASKLLKRDPALLKNSVFNVPPSVQVYPGFMRGSTWKVTSRFNGYIFPSTKIDKSRLVQSVEIPGFQKCSIVAICDVGKEVAEYEMKIEDDGKLDVAFTLRHEIDAYLGYPAVSNVLYDASRNPNRISIDFVEYRTRNAERIELFCNSRESELYNDDVNGKSDQQVFVCSEYIRQVTFGGSDTVGVARQVVGNYAHFWTWKMTQGAENELTGNLLTAAYLDPQDPLFFEEPSKPVAIYSHVLTASRLPS